MKLVVCTMDFKSHDHIMWHLTCHVKCQNDIAVAIMNLVYSIQQVTVLDQWKLYAMLNSK